MKVSKETKRIICDLVAQSEEIPQDEIVRILQDREERPLLEELYRREYNQTANRLISQVVDANNTRVSFAVRAKKGSATTYVNLDLSTDRAKVSYIKNHLLKQRDGIDKSLRKSNRRLQVIDGQITLDEYMEQC